ncbi:mitochondrial import receptor subunit TOM34 [Hippoglossus hippoglossus]|uniref:mitochondrial import receptor subunit TOM34 n=1 Tax=Hippoglossus hippoglossus TaxID=8267 RepID=UPI00148BF4C6|nr:mitochondrial import receptor subunit TOM34 [Hippoglossus hippoglossus]XP_034441596.1 mitochondrial import receptor subunit TOM34 [Hippoglossus hippoglossus]XP_034441597.1 mitochondrial import receptor subunit TOM34 [Hippoglossus hippoglossus]XP_034441598.1 mitochondrial import receptor subunit TOM34 [Hippoglossus hippoglossus]XP_035007889.2 mitochondrial import receptor subunit TOM34 [Hippoglossus stenolepis]XP_035007890.2 mitochondrial import receptor subunit TOM34 [Hippoglossus stenolepi
MPQKQKSRRSWLELKQAGNDRFKTGQYGEASGLYSEAIRELEKASEKKPEDLAILYSNRAASYLKEGNCAECVKDCNMSLELQPFNVKSLLRRAAASEAVERYRLAYVDYKTALQIDCNIAAAHEGTNRMSKALTEADGPSWREKLPPIPTVPLSIREKLTQQSPNNILIPTPAPQQNGSREAKKKAPSDKNIKKAQAQKEEGNALVKKGEFRKAIEKYSQSIKNNPTEITTYTNRALCYLSVKQYSDAVRDCDDALMIDSGNIKALYRRAQAHKELQDLKTCVDDLNNLLHVDPKNTAALKLMEDVQMMK